MDYTPLLSFGQTIIQGKVLSTIFMTPWAPAYVVYFASACELIMTFVAAAYVAVHTVEAGVSFGRGLYYNYAGWTSMADLIFLWELFVIVAFLFWSILSIVFGMTGASLVWAALNERVAEVTADS